jgi:hypothetical protein
MVTRFDLVLLSSFADLSFITEHFLDSRDSEQLLMPSKCPNGGIISALTMMRTEYSTYA